MRLIRLFFISICVFGVLIFLLSLLLPAEAFVERSGVIDAPMPAVYAHVSDLREWPQWNPWASAELTGGKPEYSNVTSGLGASYSWTSVQNERRITGTVTIKGYEEGHGLQYAMDVAGMRPVKGTIALKPAADGKATAIMWRLEIHSGWLPWWKLKGFLADRVSGPTMEDGLTKLKIICEGKP